MDSLIERLLTYKPYRIGEGDWFGPKVCEEAADELTVLREALTDARACLIDHLRYMKEPESARIIKRIDAILAKQGGEDVIANIAADLAAGRTESQHDG